ncbi:MAG: hypothetical protein MUF49_03115 [Oculatellaceae cyanobacterium Prado106]|jgi:hypothetical protein|nr:hypothetical protein [Oculatellaceae cyanobacterium Prado106]
MNWTKLANAAIATLSLFIIATSQNPRFYQGIPTLPQVNEAEMERSPSPQAHSQTKILQTNL